MIRRKDAIAFVDWRSQISNAKQVKEKRASRKAELTLKFVAETISTSLEMTSEADIYRVTMKLYHGWHTGLTPSVNRRALDQIFKDYSAPNVVGKTSFEWQHPFGDILLAAEDFRKHPRLRNHLPDTLREDLEQSGRPREKMVDTAMAADLLTSARSQPTEWRIVMAEDDDVVPAIFVAERWGKPHGGKTVILRAANRATHLNLSGLVWQIRAQS